MGLGLKKKFKKIKKAAKSVASGVGKIATGRVGSGIQKIGDGVGEVGKIAAPYVGLIPGIGTAVGGALGAASSALAGDNRNQILNTGIKGALSGYAGSKVGGLPGLIGSGKGLIAGGLGSVLGGGAAGQAGMDTDAMLDPLGGGGLLGGLGGLLGGGANLGGLGGLLAAGGAGALLASGGKGGNEYGTQADVLSDEQKAYFARPTQQVDFDKLRQDTSASGIGLTDYVSQNWDKFSRGSFNKVPGAGSAGGLGAVAGGTPGFDMTGGNPSFTPLATSPDKAMHLARGGSPGALGALRGPGSGRSDKIQSLLSPGEFVVDAETVAMLGDGSNDEGARLLDEMREQVRKHKGKTLAKGKFSPNAKSPLSYLKGAK